MNSNAWKTCYIEQSVKKTDPDPLLTKLQFRIVCGEALKKVAWWAFVR